MKSISRRPCPIFCLPLCVLLVVLKIPHGHGLCGRHHQHTQQRRSTLPRVTFHHHDHQVDKVSGGSRVVRKKPSFLGASSAASTSTEKDEELEGQQIRSMRVKGIKDELAQLNVSTDDIFEKEELVQRLVRARRRNEGEDVRKSSGPPSHRNAENNVIVVPLYFTTLDASKKIAAVNMEGGGISISPSDQPFATIQIDVVGGGTKKSFPLLLLLDTACSGFVLRPSVVENYDWLPKLSNPVTMTGAGGTVGAAGLTQIERFTLGNDSSQSVFGPMPAALQDIGGLPSSLDGIIGLSFLSQFESVEMDFMQGRLSLYKSGRGRANDDGSVVGRATMDYLPRLGLYTVNVFFGGRGPVKMLVDSGAAGTYLNWKGVEDLGLSRTKDASFIQRLNIPMGAMGSDNVAMALTHRINVSSQLQVGSRSRNPDGLPGISLKDSKRLTIDIGDIAVLEMVKEEGLGGILGIDALMRSSKVRFCFQGSNREIELYE